MLAQLVFGALAAVAPLVDAWPFEKRGQSDVYASSCDYPLYLEQQSNQQEYSPFEYLKLDGGAIYNERGEQGFFW